jgi:tetratricopeptide (TPR) repeat protein
MASAAIAQTDGCADRKVTKKISKDMAAAQDAYNAKQWDEVLAKVAAIEANPIEKSEIDKFWLNEFAGIANVNKKNYAESLKQLESAYNSPCMDEASKVHRAKVLMQLNYQQKNYPKAIEYGQKVLDTNWEAETAIYVGNAYYIGNDYENTRKVLTDVIARQESAGTTPDEQTYRILQGACVNLKDDKCVNEQFEKLVKHYPKPMYWKDLTNTLLRDTSSDKQLLNVLRLADGVQVLENSAQFFELAQLAIAQGLPGEAQAAIEKGIQKEVFKSQPEKDRANRLLAEAKQAASLDKSTLAKQDDSARAKPTGDADVKLGAAYLSYGETDKAIEALKRGIGKGGVKNPDEAGLLLGIAYMRANNKAEAAKAFETVKQDPTMTRIAKLWLLNT